MLSCALRAHGQTKVNLKPAAKLVAVGADANHLIGIQFDQNWTNQLIDFELLRICQTHKLASQQQQQQQNSKQYFNRQDCSSESLSPFNTLTAHL